MGMDFTFGICSSPGNEEKLNVIIDSIERQNIENYEIIIIGNNAIKRDKTTVVGFDETVKRAWITKKKNLITKLAKYDNVVYMHDYIYLCDGWYDGYLKHGDGFDICMNSIINRDGTRFRDWTLWTDLEGFLGSRGFIIPYDMTHLSKYMYISGSYWVCKRHVMEKFPLDERLAWGESEDVEWSKRVRCIYKFSINRDSSVRFMKQKDKVFDYSSDNDINMLKMIRW